MIRIVRLILQCKRNLANVRAKGIRCPAREKGIWHLSRHTGSHTQQEKRCHAPVMAKKDQILRRRKGVRHLSRHKGSDTQQEKRGHAPDKAKGIRYPAGEKWSATVKA